MSHPTQAEDLTEDWIEKTLLKNVPHLVDAKVVLLQIENENAKSGTLSTICRATCLLQSNREGKTSEELQSLFIKIMPKSERFRQIANGSRMDVTEIETYKIFLPELQKFELEKTGRLSTRISPKLYSGEYDLNEKSRSWYLIMEDLSETHYMEDFGKGLSINQLILALEKLAHFHALTYSYAQVSGINFDEKYKFFNRIFTDFKADDEMRDIMAENMIHWRRIMDEDQELRSLIPNLENYREQFDSIFSRFVKRADGKVVIHGDIWVNNYLFSKSEQESCFMIDWQFTSTGNPLFDFGPVAFTSMNPEDTESNLDLILNSYYNRFRETCLNLGVKEEDLLWTCFDNFEKEAKQVGLFITFVWAILFYEVVKMYPPLKDRYIWVFKTSCRLFPEMYEEKSNPL